VLGFPQRLKELRESKNVSQAALSRELGIPRSSISHYEDQNQDEKDIRLPRRERLEQIADFFDVSVDYLLGRSDIPKATAPFSYEGTLVRESGSSYEIGEGTGYSPILFANEYPQDLQVFVRELTGRLEQMDAEQRAGVIAELTELLNRSLKILRILVGE